ncbi:MAG: hypothetical protein COV52_06140 [Gammaproteobacteria bacterium CG11_big_fil_rev_8_21_14_0_20_46_22]|nr:MAG: hypothetical protein COW05_07520 [Gammaproteobacteria bacterium CG12_big_fil_rev_8_21_14_0_65_46_12]PIR11082.1 MAG: hypothetical protein COV52_06140 [Gammaproteobacteria bacterium CG11_big_fil_rev_8_21_14_0_20_46_22]
MPRSKTSAQAQPLGQLGATFLNQAPQVLKKALFNYVIDNQSRGLSRQEVEDSLVLFEDRNRIIVKFTSIEILKKLEENGIRVETSNKDTSVHRIVLTSHEEVSCLVAAFGFKMTVKENELKTTDGESCAYVTPNRKMLAQTVASIAARRASSVSPTSTGSANSAPSSPPATSAAPPSLASETSLAEYISRQLTSQLSRFSPAIPKVTVQKAGEKGFVAKIAGYRFVGGDQKKSKESLEFNGERHFNGIVAYGLQVLTENEGCIFDAVKAEAGPLNIKFELKDRVLEFRGEGGSTLGSVKLEGSQSDVLKAARAILKQNSPRVAQTHAAREGADPAPASAAGKPGSPQNAGSTQAGQRAVNARPRYDRDTQLKDTSDLLVIMRDDIFNGRFDRAGRKPCRRIVPKHVQEMRDQFTKAGLAAGTTVLGSLGEDQQSNIVAFILASVKHAIGEDGLKKKPRFRDEKVHKFYNELREAGNFVQDVLSQPQTPTR